MYLHEIVDSRNEAPLEALKPFVDT